MNVNTGELFRVSPEMKDKFEKCFKEEGSVKAVPDEFSEEADRLLGDQGSVFVDMDEPTPLVNWAKDQRNKPHPDGNRKQRRRMAKESRQRNKR